MTKILNLDDLETGLEKTVTIKGVDYVMVPLSVEAFINQMKEIAALGDKELSALEMYEMSLTVIQRAFPGLSDETLHGLNTHQVDALYAFLKETGEEQVEAGLEAVNDPAGK